MRHLWSGKSPFEKPPRTYKTYENAVKFATELLGDLDVPVIIAASVDGRFFPVAIGERAAQHGAHFHMCVAS